MSAAVYRFADPEFGEGLPKAKAPKAPQSNTVLLFEVINHATLNLSATAASPCNPSVWMTKW